MDPGLGSKNWFTGSNNIDGTVNKSVDANLKAYKAITYHAIWVTVKMNLFITKIHQLHVVSLFKSCIWNKRSICKKYQVLASIRRTHVRYY